ncbi:MAG: histidinol-phosphate aminotransferase [Planctomycetota bacterium]|jgi:histidinol-phosphate aminotransferase
MMPQPRTDWESLKSYSRAKSATPVGWKLDGNEGVGPSDEWAQAAMEGAQVALSEYPRAASLEEKLAACYGRKASEVLVTAGADEGLDRLCRAYLEPGRNAVIPAPCFEMMPRYVALARGELRSPAWPLGASPVKSILEACDQKTGLVIIATPNNPTGSVLSLEEIVRLAEGLPQTLIVIDLAYVEYADSDPTTALREFANVVCLRTFSKAWGLASLRVGFVLGEADIIDVLKRAGGPFAVAGLSMALAGKRLQESEELQAQVRQVRVERNQLFEQGKRLGLRAWPSEANFVFFEGARVKWLHDSLAGFGIAARLFTSPNGASLRITCPGEPQGMKLLSRAIECALAPPAILFDLDGVLADVSRSYRRAIVETAAEYGVALSANAISRRKALGNANDDWELTRELLADNGVLIAREEVIGEFERRYQGQTGQPGLYEGERLLFTKERLVALASICPLGIVTGRPRKDMQRFLEQFDLGDVFRICVAREDAAQLKPSPAPIEVALGQLGVDSAWYLGDTPDDMQAARAAQCLPIGVIAAGEDRENSSSVLLKAGAGTVLDMASEIEEVLSC